MDNLSVRYKNKISKEVLKFPLGYWYLSPEETQRNRKAVYRFPKKAGKIVKRRFKILYLYYVFSTLSTTIVSSITPVWAIGLPVINRLQSNPFLGKSMNSQYPI